MHNSKELAFTFMLVFFSLFCLIVTAHYIWPTPYYWPRGGGGTLNCSSIYPSPKKNINKNINFKHPQKIFEILATQKNIHILYNELKKIP